MRFRQLKFIFLIIVAFLLSGVLLSSPVEAGLIERSSINLDERLSDQSTNNYADIQSIVMVEIDSPQSITYGDSEEWFKGLYYYMITRLGFADIPVNYVVSWDGDIYEAKDGYFDVLPIVDWQNSDVPGSSIVVAYFGNNRQITSFGSNSLTELISNLAGLYELDSEDIYAGSLYLASREEELELSKLLIKTPSEEWETYVSQIASSVTPVDDYWTVEYNSTIKSVDVPSEIQAGNEVEVTVVAENTGNMPWFNAGTNPVFVATSDPRNRNSDFAVSESWASLSRVVGAMESVVLPGDDAHFVFDIRTSLVSGSFSESFELMQLPGFWIPNSEIQVSFQTQPSDYNLVEIQSTETGFLNLRNCPGTGCDEIGRVVPGDIIINLGEDNGWYKVRLDSGVEGWVYGRYVTELQ